MEMIQKEFGHIGSEIVYSYTLKNKNGVEVTCINYGGRITSIKTPDKNGKIEEITLGYETLEGYKEDTCYLGALCGRVAGRIGGASFELDGVTYDLAKNNGENHLHGGETSFSQVIWQGEFFEKEGSAGVVFTYFSKDKEEGYPGNVNIKATYLLNEDNQLIATYEGTPDQTTLLNMTNHAYFNLSGDGKRTILSHHLTMKASKFAPLDGGYIPTGELRAVEGTPFDVTSEKQLQALFSQEDEQLAMGLQGFDHPFLLDTHFAEEIILEDKESGRKLIVETDQPAVVVYTGNQLSEEIQLRGRVAEKYLGICLETQGMPDAIHHQNFPQVTVNKDETYRAKTVYTFC